MTEAPALKPRVSVNGDASEAEAALTGFFAQTTEVKSVEPNLNENGKPHEAGALARWGPWIRRSEELTVWTLKTLVNRRDCCGRYFLGEDDKPAPFTFKHGLTDGMILQHYRARDCKDIIGVHAAVFEPMEGCDRGGSSFSRWLRIDIDNHGDGPAPPENLAAALAWYGVLADLGFNLLLIDSNGRGGYWIIAIFEEPMLTLYVRRFGQWLTRNWAELGLSACPEFFPKSDGVRPKGSDSGEFGTWVRLPGRHHSRDFWSRVWDGSEFLEGDDAIDLILNCVGDSSRLIPQEALRLAEELRHTAPKQPVQPRSDEEVKEVVQLARGALACLSQGAKDSFGHEFYSEYDPWILIGMSLYELGDEGLELWLEWSLTHPKYERSGKFSCEEKWKTFHSADEGGVTLGTLFYHAKKNGWVFSERATKTQQSAPPTALASDGHRQGLPEIICGSEDPAEGLKKWSPAAIEALGAANKDQAIGIFQHDGILCRVKPGDADGPPAIEPFQIDSLRGALDRAGHWGETCLTRKGPRVKWGPPRLDIVRDILALASYDLALFPPIDLIVESPRFLPDGSLVLTPGYHLGGRFWYAPSADLAGLEVPLVPTDQQVEAAKTLILGELLIDFPFANVASRTNALAAMLVPFVRQMIDGPTPNHHFTASTEGTGKGLCAAACAFPALGREIDLNPQKESEAEWRKALTSAFMAGTSHFLIDNMYNPLGWNDMPMLMDSGTLAMAWTARYWRDRILGGNQEARIRIQTVFMSTGNNVMFSRELERRIISIELLAPCENPSARTGFRHDPLLDWARENRRSLVQACLILCRRWIADGMPSGVEVMGSYENYARVMGGILGSCGVEGFLHNRVRRAASNPETERWNALVSEWHRLHKGTLVSTTDVWSLIRLDEALAERFHDVLGDGKDLSQKQKLGRALERVEGRVFKATADTVVNAAGPGAMVDREVEPVVTELRLVRSTATTANKTALWRLQNPSVKTDGENPNQETTHVPF